MEFENVKAVKDACERLDKKYLVVGGHVVDIDGYRHPGPQNLLTDNIGTDVTEEFNLQGHS
jgi:cytochrome b involved in lipid metabolism